MATRTNLKNNNLSSHALLELLGRIKVDPTNNPVPMLVDNGLMDFGGELTEKGKSYIARVLQTPVSLAPKAPRKPMGSDVY